MKADRKKVKRVDVWLTPELHSRSEEAYQELGYMSLAGYMRMALIRQLAQDGFAPEESGKSKKRKAV